MADVNTPHFKLPLNFNGRSATVLEQDDEEEIMQTASTVLYYERGQRKAIPEYGLREQVLRENGADLQEIQDTMTTWDDRASFAIRRESDLEKIVEDATDYIVVDVGGEE